MCHSITISKEEELAWIQASGKVNGLELKDIFFETVAHDGWQPGFNMLCDYRDIDDFDVSFEDIDDLTECLVSIDRLIGGGRCAVVASSDSVYGMNQMLEVASTERLQQVCTFRQMEDAVSWLE